MMARHYIALPPYGKIVKNGGREVSVKKAIENKFVRLAIVFLILIIYFLFLVLNTDPFELRDYEKLGRGMTVSEVSKTLGNKGKVIYENTRSDGTVVSSISWTNPDGSAVDGVFENGKLRSLSQRGLSNQ